MNNSKILYRVISISIFCLVLLICFTQLKKVKPFEVQKLLPENHPLRIDYDKFSKSYDDENKVFILFKNNTKFTPSTLTDLFTPLNKHFSLMKEISYFSNITNAKYIHFDKNGYQLQPFLKNKEIQTKAILKLETDFWSNSLISTDKKSALASITLSSKIDKKKRVPTVESIIKTVKSNLPSHINAYFIGTEVANYWFTKEMIKNQTIITPLLMLSIAIFFYLIFKSIGVVIISQIIITINYALTIIMITLFEEGIGPYSSFALMFITIVATADLIHFFTKLFEENGNIQKTIDEIKKACFLTSLTTAIGFGALIMNENVPVRYFGFYCAIGTFFCFFVTFYIMPFFIKSVNLKFSNRIGINYEFNIFKFNRKFKKYILLFFSLTTALFIFYSSRLTIDDNLYKKFVPDHELSKAVDNFSNGLNFVGSIDIVIKPKKGFILDEENLDEIKRIENEIKSLPMTSHIKSFTQLNDNIKNEINGSKYKDTKPFLNLLYDYGALNSFYKKTKNEIRTTIFLNSMNSVKLEEMIKHLQKISFNHQSIDFNVQGFATIRNYINQNVIKSFMTSFGTSLILISLIFLLLFRSVKWALLAMIPNIYPLILISGLMGIFNITMESNLVILISITIGIAVDDTIHIVVKLKDLLSKGFSINKAIEKCLNTTGKALFRTTLIFVFSFPTFLLSELTLFYQAGIFILLSLVSALFADILLLPSLLLILDKAGNDNDHI